MKRNILYITLFLSLIYNMYGQEFGFLKIEGKPKLENLINNELVNTKIVCGKTYTSALNSYNISTSTNDSVVLKFACDTAIKLNDNSSFNIDNYEQTTQHSQHPQQTTFDTFNCQTSLIEGEAEIINSIYNDTNSFYINTKLACIICGKGKFVVKTDGSSSTFIIVEGNATIMDNMGRKLYKVKQNDIITVTSRPVLGGRAGEMMRKQNLVTTSNLESTDYNVLSGDFTIFDNEQKQYIFITDNVNKLVKLRN